MDRPLATKKQTRSSFSLWRISPLLTLTYLILTETMKAGDGAVRTMVMMAKKWWISFLASVARTTWLTGSFPTPPPHLHILPRPCLLATTTGTTTGG